MTWGSVLDTAILVALVAGVSAVAGGGIWTFAGAFMSTRAAGRVSDIGRLTGEVSALRLELSTCEERHGVLETRLRAVEQRSTSYFAMWIKDRRGRLVWLNDKAFLTIFAPLGYARDELDGKTFAEILDPVAAGEIEMLDKAALAMPGHTQSILVQLHPDLPFMVVIKVASIAETGEVQYEGCAYNPSDPEIRNAAGARRQIIQRGVSAMQLLDCTAEELDDKP